MEQYPITKNLERELEQYLDIPAVRMIVDTVGEYEHGTADLEEFTNVTLGQYAEIALDLALVIGNTLRPHPNTIEV